MKILLEYVDESIKRYEERVDFWRGLGDDRYADGMDAGLKRLKFVRDYLEEEVSKVKG